MGDGSSGDGGSVAIAKMSLGAAQAAATSTLERTKSRRETLSVLDMKFPALLVLAPPHLHRFLISLDSSVFCIELQCAFYFPRHVGKLQHRNRNVADSDRSVEFLALADSRDEVREVGVRHGIAADQIRRRSRMASLQFACLVSF